MSLLDAKYDGCRVLADRMSQSIISDSVSHAYIIEGDAVTDKKGLALDFIKGMMCREKPGAGCDKCLSCRKIADDNFEDLHIIRAEFNASKTSKSVRDEAIEKLIDRLSRKYYGERGFAVIEDADSMTPRAQNHLLKTLEEPPDGTVIFLLSENTEHLLQTIRSRCVIYRLYSYNADVSNENFDDDIRNADVFLNLVIDSAPFYECKAFLTEYVGDKDRAVKLLDSLEIKLRNVLLEKDERYRMIKREKVMRAIILTEQAKKDLKMNVNYGYALKNLYLKLKA